MLSDRYTIDDVQRMLVSHEDWHPYPTRNEREAWEATSRDAREDVIAKGDASLGFEWQVFRASQFLEMARTGLRSLYGRHRQGHRVGGDQPELRGAHGTLVPGRGVYAEACVRRPGFLCGGWRDHL